MRNFGTDEGQMLEGVRMLTCLGDLPKIKT
jgi:hypothetical protein